MVQFAATISEDFNHDSAAWCITSALVVEMFRLYVRLQKKINNKQKAL